MRYLKILLFLLVGVSLYSQDDGIPLYRLQYAPDTLSKWVIIGDSTYGEPIWAVIDGLGDTLNQRGNLTILHDSLFYRQCPTCPFNFVTKIDTIIGNEFGNMLRSSDSLYYRECPTCGYDFISKIDTSNVNELDSFNINGAWYYRADTIDTRDSIYAVGYPNGTAIYLRDGEGEAFVFVAEKYLDGYTTTVGASGISPHNQKRINLTVLGKNGAFTPPDYGFVYDDSNYNELGESFIRNDSLFYMRCQECDEYLVGVIDTSNTNELDSIFLNGVWIGNGDTANTITVVDSIYRSLDTIFLRDGSGFVLIDTSNINELDSIFINGIWYGVGDTLNITYDGSETKINSGTSINVTGAGTIGSPYVVNNTAPESTNTTDSGTIDFTQTGDNITAIVKDGSITPVKLDRTYLESEVDGDVNNERGTVSRSSDSLFYKQCPACSVGFVTKIDTSNVNEYGTLLRSNDSLFYRPCPTCSYAFATRIDTSNLSEIQTLTIDSVGTASDRRFTIGLSLANAISFLERDKQAIDSLYLVGNILRMKLENSAVKTLDLSTFESFWSRNSGSGFVYPKTITDKVGINTSSPSHYLTVNGYDASINGVIVGRGYGGGTSNTIVGNEAFNTGLVQFDNTAVGYYALRNNTGYRNTAIGSNTMSIMTGSNNVGVGYGIMTNASGGGNIGIGNNALFRLTSGQSNIAFGTFGLQYVTTGSANIGIGGLGNLTTGSNNIGIGESSLFGQTTGSNNTALGRFAGYDVTSGTYNLFLGYNVGRGITTGGTNVALGYEMAGLNAATAGSILIKAGGGSLIADNSYNYNLSSGDFSKHGSRGTYNFFYSLNAGGANMTSASNNIGMGLYSLNGTTTASYNIAMGNESMRYAKTGGHNIGLGYRALFSDSLGTFNIGLGYRALHNTTSGTENVAIGTDALYPNTSGSYNVSIGSASMIGNTTGSYNNAIGRQALRLLSSGNENVANGYASMFSLTTGTGNTAMGTNSMFAQITGNQNSAFGTYALAATTTANYNAAFGFVSLGNANVGNYNAAFGSYSLRFAGTATTNNTALGSFAGYNNTGSNNIFLGYESGYNAVSSNLLYIENTNSQTPLVGGDFSANRVGINRLITGLTATLNVGGNLIVDTRTATATKVGGFSAGGEITELTLGTGVSITSNVLNVADNSPTNEIQTISKSGNTVSQSLSGGSFNIASDTPAATEVLTWDGTNWVASAAAGGADYDLEGYADSTGFDLMENLDVKKSVKLVYEYEEFTVGGGSGVSDHGDLTGLADDDHVQYLNTARGDARYYTEIESDGLLATKANVSHTHDLGDVDITGASEGDVPKIVSGVLSWAADGGGGGVSDGDKGEVIVSGSGATWLLDTGIDAAKIGGGGVSTTEYNYIGGLTSDAQTQINGKAATSHTHAVGDLTTGSATTGQVLTYNGSAWAPATPSGGSVTTQEQSGSGTVTTSYTTIADISLAAGTWKIDANASCLTNAGMDVQFELYNVGSSTILMTSRSTASAAVEYLNFGLNRLATLGSTTTIRLRAKTSNGTCTAASGENYITAIK